MPKITRRYSWYVYESLSDDIFSSYHNSVGHSSARHAMNSYMIDGVYSCVFGVEACLIHIIEKNVEISKF